MTCEGKISAFLEPIREKRQQYENHLDDVKEILHDGERRAKVVAENTMLEVHEKMKLG